MEWNGMMMAGDVVKLCLAGAFAALSILQCSWRGHYRLHVPYHQHSQVPCFPTFLHQVTRCCGTLKEHSAASAVCTHTHDVLSKTGYTTTRYCSCRCRSDPSAKLSCMSC
ncbi:hypothetical protein EDD15DRAFT_636848 [Pisolithus albus]|nr:hypothetical protein EDD15DRAFT_636848 [Pisolithus albus]